MTSFTPELELVLDEALGLTKQGKTVLFMFEDMVEVNERFQAILDWFKEHGNKMRRRYGQGAFLESGMAYFVGADTHLKDGENIETVIDTRGVSKEYDMREFAPLIVRQTGLEAKLRASHAAKMKAQGKCCGNIKTGLVACDDCPELVTAA